MTRKHTLNISFNNYSIDEFSRVAADFGISKYAFVVTPNTDHLIRYYDDEKFRDLYAEAEYILLDSRILSRLLRITHLIYAKVCTGSDLTARLFSEVILQDDRIVLIGGDELQADLLRKQYGLRQMYHFNPPMGFIRSPALVDQCLSFIECHAPFRFCLLAIGSPQQEFIAQQLKVRGKARGLALCIGASIDFLTGKEHRAPPWVQAISCEWLFRLLQNPKRLAARYLLRAPRIFLLLRKFQISMVIPP